VIADHDAATVGDMTDVIEPDVARDTLHADDQSTWLQPLRASGREHDDAVRRLHELLLRAAHHEVRRRAASMGVAGSSELSDLAMQAADDALVAILGRLDTFEGRSAFTTWAYKFAIHIAGIAVRRMAWRGREVPTSDDALEDLASTHAGPDVAVEQRERVAAVVAANGTQTPPQRDVVLALCVCDVPIDVLADRLGATRGAIYKTLHDARVAIRRRVAEPTSEGGPRG
jgi:RNA polymerase sigma-70 factor (ECF subfamily)